MTETFNFTFESRSSSPCYEEFLLSGHRLSESAYQALHLIEHPQIMADWVTEVSWFQLSGPANNTRSTDILIPIQMRRPKIVGNVCKIAHPCIRVIKLDEFIWREKVKIYSNLHHTIQKLKHTHTPSHLRVRVTESFSNKATLYD